MKDGIHPTGYVKLEYKKQTNGDKIRSMSDEELAGSRVDRIDFYTKSDIPEYIGDFDGIANGIEEAIALEIEWLQSVGGGRMSKSILKPCPFCGRNATTSEKENIKSLLFGRGWIGCQACHVHIDWSHGERGRKLAFEAWNRRVDDEDI